MGLYGTKKGDEEKVKLTDLSSREQEWLISSFINQSFGAIQMNSLNEQEKPLVAGISNFFMKHDNLSLFQKQSLENILKEMKKNL